MTVYADSSVVVRIAARQAQSLSAWASTSAPVASTLVEVEVPRAIDRLRRASELSQDAAVASLLRARELLRGVMLVELSGDVLRRALRPFPRPVRTLDGLHLSTLDFVRAQRESVALASYDERLITAARSMRFRIHAL